MDLEGMKIVLDCAHGSTYHIAPFVFRELGAEVITIGAEPNGLNINAGFGATSPNALQKRVVEEKATLGIALDGDGDRLIMVDHKGEVIDGDEILFILAKTRKAKGYLGNVVVGTLMTNLGVEHAFNKIGVELQRSDVGDRHVIELMNKTGAILGGEGSGHIICADRTTTGDGIIAALQVLETVVRESTTLHSLKLDIQKYPQCMINVRLAYNVKYSRSTAIDQAVKEAEAVLGDKGRVLLRPSGTEPLVRVMIEGQDNTLVEKLTKELAGKVEAILAN